MRYWILVCAILSLVFGVQVLAQTAKPLDELDALLLDGSI